MNYEDYPPIAGVLASAAVAVMIAALGCTTPRGPEFLTISAEQYDEAFDAAANVARAHGLAPGLRDRRGGVIETEPGRAGTILEPWDRLNTSFARAFENTISHQQRIARFEFLPVRFVPDRARPDELLTGPDIFAERRAPMDLTAYDGELELRVWVYVERSHRPGVRRSSWTRRNTTTAQIIDPDTGDRLRPIWTPTTRDPEAEQRLLARVQRELSR